MTSFSKLDPTQTHLHAVYLLSQLQDGIPRWSMPASTAASPQPSATKWRDAAKPRPAAEGRMD